MSEIIHLLPDSVANQIAAGEVIQRPASVVKELVENSIDAGATCIQVIVQDAGRTLVQVIDNGKGMSEKDAVLAFERHATSKIQDASDLFHLHTMGFRGEALASIAAVAEVELRTCQADGPLGTRVVIAGTKLIQTEPVACPLGCSFSVRNLFFNVPARRKFLKSNATELNNILQEFQRIALVHPELEMHLFSNGSELMNLQPSNLKGRVAAVFSRKINEQLLPVGVDTSIVRISGFVGKPEHSHKKGLHQYFFVNGRYMRHPYFHKAVMQAFDQLIPSGDQVSYFIYFEVDPESIDVNIHPTKTEIKFEGEQDIWKILLSCIKESLGRFSAVPTLDFDVEDRPEDMPAFRPDYQMPQPRVHVSDSYNPFQTEASRAYDRQMDYNRKRTDSWDQLYEGVEHDRDVIRMSSDISEDDGLMMESGTETVTAPLLEAHSFGELFQFDGSYILLSREEGLMLVDQHRAHVRVLFERYMGQFESRRSASQGQLFPQVLELSASEALVLETIMEDAQAVGFELTALGPSAFAIQGVPAGFEGVDTVALVMDMIHTAQEETGDARRQIRERLAMVMARRSAIAYGQVLTPKEMADLLECLFQTVSPQLTPDGLPVIRTISREDITKLFSR